MLISESKGDLMPNLETEIDYRGEISTPVDRPRNCKICEKFPASQSAYIKKAQAALLREKEWIKNNPPPLFQIPKPSP